MEPEISNREAAERIGVAHSLVSRVRKEVKMSEHKAHCTVKTA